MAINPGIRNRGVVMVDDGKLLCHGVKQQVHLNEKIKPHPVQPCNVGRTEIGLVCFER